MTLSDAQPCNATRYAFRLAPRNTTPHTLGLSGSVISLSGRAVPLYPGELDGCLCLCLHHPHGLPRIRNGWPLSSWFFEAYMDSLALRLTPSWSRGFDEAIACHPRSRHYMCHRHFT